MSRLKVKQVRSSIGRQKNQRETLRSLGLKRIGDVVVKEDRPEIRGMIARVPHLVSVIEVPVREGSSNEVPGGEGETS